VRSARLESTSGWPVQTWRETLADHRIVARAQNTGEHNVDRNMLYYTKSEEVDKLWYLPARKPKVQQEPAKPNTYDATRRDTPSKHLTMPLFKPRGYRNHSNRAIQCYTTLCRLLLLLCLHRRTFETGALMSLRSLTPSIICFCGVPCPAAMLLALPRRCRIASNAAALSNGS
jgi:hypothetical protein